jgi:hypothetical protein
MSPDQRYQFDVLGYFVIKGHYSAAAVAEFNRGIDELQAASRRGRHILPSRRRSHSALHLWDL